MRISPFRVDVPQAVLDDLQHRLSHVRWPTAPVGELWHYGSSPDYMARLLDHWRHRFDWRAWEARINAHEQLLVEVDGLTTHVLVARADNPDALPMHSNEIIAVLKQTPTGLQELIEALPPRHPSQLYEALLEGLFLFVVLYLVRTRCSKNLPHGVLTGLFFILYAIVRIFGETYRVPDSSLIMGITKGQFYSVFMIGIGLAFLFNAWVSQRRTIAK